jgi:hypothetical protein
MVNQKKGCLYYFGIVLFIATLPISLPIVMYIESNERKEQDISNPTAPPVNVSENPMQGRQKNSQDTDEPTND